jgi:cytochrome c peroxidase
MPTMIGRLAAVFVAGGAIGAIVALLLPSAEPQAAPAQTDLAALKASFRRPATVPFPADNSFSEKKRALGEALFHDKRLSVDGSLACASCHERGKGIADGKAQGRGVPGRPLKRHTPTLWNLASRARSNPRTRWRSLWPPWWRGSTPIPPR